MLMHPSHFPDSYVPPTLDQFLPPSHYMKLKDHALLIHLNSWLAPYL